MASRKAAFAGLALFLGAAYIAGYMYAAQRYRGYRPDPVTGLAVLVAAAAGIAMAILGMALPEPPILLVAGEEAANMAFGAAAGATRLVSIRLPGEPRGPDALLGAVAEYYTRERGYRLLDQGEAEDGFYMVFRRGIRGLRGLLGRRVTVTVFLVIGENRLEAYYSVGAGPNMLLRGEALLRAVDAEAIGLYRYIRLRWTSIAG